MRAPIPRRIDWRYVLAFSLLALVFSTIPLWPAPPTSTYTGTVVVLQDNAPLILSTNDHASDGRVLYRFVPGPSTDDVRIDFVFIQDTITDEPVGFYCPPEYRRFCDTLKLGQRVWVRLQIDTLSDTKQFGIEGGAARGCQLRGIEMRTVAK